MRRDALIIRIWSGDQSKGSRLLLEADIALAGLKFIGKSVCASPTIWGKDDLTDMLG